MKRVGVREFRDRATQYLSGGEVLAIERHGQPIGFYIPTGPNPRESLAQALERLEETVQRVRAEAGLSEEQISALFDLNQPLPDSTQAEQPGLAASTSAPGR